MSAQTQAIQEGCPNCKIPLVEIKGECVLDVPESLLDQMIALSNTEPATPIFTEINALCPVCGYVIVTYLSRNDYEARRKR